jgi:hypothetical protein
MDSGSYVVKQFGLYAMRLETTMGESVYMPTSSLAEKEVCVYCPFINIDVAPIVADREHESLRPSVEFDCDACRCGVHRR